ncbi:hypothetical protein [Flavisolibacter nicotianae]|uniref:hypothetical protein n=1 Tax=Flavisolibacter nicotianae TaxID=2364882 RepID=UPI000EAE9C31|nr:hypothetical protein [Flavisolibacter nicotianae]
MEAVFRIFMYLFPYGASIALYIWVFRKAQRVPNKVAKGIALALVVAGLGYTAYQIATTVGAVMTDDRFHFQIMIITIVVLFFASIAMAFGEPEDKKE